ncbi:DUF551 domain-containing protein [Atlantibacter subterraneus]|uniref:DUF551 domain-containing protein n=1 Tax=Atlantibacter subterraneus TaxID=255519 RepID=UPI0028A040E6|nr:DUF551 domain-containing protein [Atlantibacter subterranea]
MTINERVSQERLNAIKAYPLHALFHMSTTELESILSELQQYRAAAVPVCPKCGGTGMADSGGFQPWGEPILIECDCQAAPQVTSVPDDAFERALLVLNDTLDDCGDSERGLLLALDRMGIEVREPTDDERLMEIEDVGSWANNRNTPTAAPAVQAKPLSVTDAEHVASVLEMIGSFEPDDIDSDSVDLRFELDGVDTGSDVSITEYATRGAAIIRQLSGNTEQVSQPTLPKHFPCADAPDHIWLQTAGEWPASGEFSELTWSCDNQHPDDTLYVRADMVGNSPVIPDSWIPVSERMPGIGTRVLIGDVERSGVYEAVRFDGNRFNRFGCEIIADYWMPLPAAPQQEANNG